MIVFTPFTPPFKNNGLSKSYRRSDLSQYVPVYVDMTIIPEEDKEDEYADISPPHKKCKSSNLQKQRGRKRYTPTEEPED